MRFGRQSVQWFSAICLTMVIGVVLYEQNRASLAADEKAAGQPVVGIQKRVPWTTSKITGSLEPPHPYKLEPAFPNLQLTNPVSMVTAPGSERVFVVEVSGKVVSFVPSEHVKTADICLDLKKLHEKSSRIYGIAFHPNFETNRYVYLCYIAKGNDPNGTRVSRFTMTRTDPPTFDPASETKIIEWQAGGHNGGCLKFGPRDGYLYITTGDASSPSPPDVRNTGQDNSDLLAAILRIDVDQPADGKAYSIPANNPFVGLANTRPEVWSYGFRNPWRMSFDNETGWLWVGDVGWEMWEMIYRIERGGNYGWSIVEGPQSVKPGQTQGETPILPPVISHSHIESRSITGGAVYHGPSLKELDGAYIYGDYVTGIIWGLRYDGNKVTWKQELVDSTLAVVAFGEDTAGEMYVLDYEGGLYRLAKNDAAQANADFPRKLSETGLFASVKEFTPAPGVLPYSVNSEPWADGATAERFLAVPGAPKLEIWEENNIQKGNVRGNWKFPTDAVFAKTLSLEMEPGNPDSARNIETQILHYDVDTWRAYTYMWNEDGTDATLVPAEGTSKTFQLRDPAAPNQQRQQTWHFASRTECIVCHTTRGGSIYGFIPPQLKKQHAYGDVAADQLATLMHIDLIDDPEQQKLKNPEHQVGTMPDPFDESLPLEDRARAYLHVNCGQCHRRGGGGTAKFESLYHFTQERMGLIGERPTQGAFKIHAAENVAAADPYRSVLYYRLAKLGSGHMPKIGSSTIDSRGLRLMHDWIAQLPPSKDADSQSETTAKLRAEQKTALAAVTKTGDETAVDQLLETTSGALMLLSAIDADTINEKVRQHVIARGTEHSSAEVSGLFERFIPEEKRVKRLGNVIKPEELLAMPGDAARGQAVFLQTAGVQCKNCHQIAGQGKKVGPELTKIGKKYNRAQLLESILEPSKKIDKEFVTYIVETTAGRVHTGLLLKRNDDEIILNSSEGKPIRIAADDIEVVVPQQKSLMPELLLKEMTAQQVADLLAYLAELK